MSKMEPLLLTPDEAAEVLRISKSYLYDLKSRGDISFIKIGTNLRFRRSDLEKFIEKKAKHTERILKQQEFVA
mgnify:FL=1|jgi:excisionase family DNA binding protein|tara:strand:- start:563 stop:781 length:219 start_codon:yes stop_codon:yes gene_type:complete